MPRPPARPKSASPSSSRTPKSLPLKKQSPRQAAKTFREDALASGQLAKQYDLRVAAKLKAAIETTLARVRFGKPLEADDAPRPGPGGHLVAPNGDPLIRVKLGDAADGGSQYALVSPKTNQFYKEDNLGAPVHVTNLYGPLSLPRGSHLGEKKHNQNDLRQLESAANAAHRKSSLSKPALLAVLAKLIKRGPQGFDGQATTKEDTLSESVLKKEHPFTYTAIVRKDDPSRVIIKRVTTGGFVPAGPNDGDFSQPFSLP